MKPAKFFASGSHLDRSLHTMRTLPFLSFLVLFFGVPACFRPDQNCKNQCSSDGKCAQGFQCVEHLGKHLCARNEDTTCGEPVTPLADASLDTSPDNRPDADVDLSAADGAAPDLAPAPGRPDSGPDEDDARPDVSTDPPGEEAEVNPDSQPTSDADGGRSPISICINSSCLTPGQSVHDGLVLLLDPANLPPPGADVPLWRDQSGQGNDARIVNANAVPKSDGLGVTLGTMTGYGFVIADAASLDFGSDDFLILVAAAMTSTSEISEFFLKTNLDDPLRQIELGWIFTDTDSPPTVVGSVNDTEVIPRSPISPNALRLMGLRRVGDRVDLRVNGAVVGSESLGSGETTSSTADIYVGVPGRVGVSVERVSAVMAIHGSVDEDDLQNLESFLVRVLNITL